jgi:hypothetical protein
MSLTPRGMSVQEAYRLYKDDSFIVNRKYQRKLVWTVDEKEYLIDSVLNGFPILKTDLHTRASTLTLISLLEQNKPLKLVVSLRSLKQANFLMQNHPQISLIINWQLQHILQKMRR